MFDHAIGEAELAFLETWVGENPGSKQFVRLAWAYSQAGRDDKATKVLEKGLLINPSFVEARAFLAAVLEKQGDLPAAAEQLTLAAEELQGHYPVFEELGRVLRALGRDGDAERSELAAEALAQVLDHEESPEQEAAPEPPMQAPAGGVDPKKLVSRLSAFSRAARRRAQSVPS